MVRAFVLPMAAGPHHLIEQATVQFWDNRPFRRHHWLLIVLQLREGSKSYAADRMDPEVPPRKMEIFLKTILWSRTQGLVSRAKEF
jgi:hypothetical protein